MLLVSVMASLVKDHGGFTNHMMNYLKHSNSILTICLKSVCAYNSCMHVFRGDKLHMCIVNCSLNSLNQQKATFCPVQGVQHMQKLFDTAHFLWQEFRQQKHYFSAAHDYLWILKSLYILLVLDILLFTWLSVLFCPFCVQVQRHRAWCDHVNLGYWLVNWVHCWHRWPELSKTYTHIFKVQRSMCMDCGNRMCLRVCP